MRRTILLSVLFLLFTCGIFSEPVKPGWWLQTASTAGNGENIAMEVKSVTPHIITLDSNNGWLGYAWYVEEKDMYTGFFELLMPIQQSDKTNWAGEVFQFILDFDGLTLTMKAKSKQNNFMATFWKKESYNTSNYKMK